MAIDIGTPRLPLSDIVTWVRAVNHPMPKGRGFRGECPMKEKPRPGSTSTYPDASLSDLTKSRLMAVALAEANHGSL